MGIQSGLDDFDESRFVMTFLTIAEHILSSEERKKCKKGKTVRVTVRDPSRKANHLSKVI